MLKITSNEAEKIIDTRKPLGKFYFKEDGLFIAIDNSTGDAWTEEFKKKQDCFDYLNGKELNNR